MVCCTAEVVVSTTGVLAMTVTSSLTPATASSKLITASAPTVSVTPLRTERPKPWSSALISYEPGGIAAIRYRPSLSLIPVRVKPVWVLRAATVTPGSAAFCASVIAPMSVAVSCCAASGRSAIGIHNIAARAAMNTYRICTSS